MMLLTTIASIVRQEFGLHCGSAVGFHGCLAKPRALLLSCMHAHAHRPNRSHKALQGHCPFVLHHMLFLPHKVPRAKGEACGL